MLGRLWVAGCTLWPGRWGVRASVAQQPVSAEAGAPCVGETWAPGRARRGELSRTQWLCCAAWTWGRWSGKVGRGRRADVLVRLVDGVGLAMGGRRACCLLLFPGNCRASALDDTRRRGLHHRGLHCECTGSRRRCVSTVNGCTHGGTGGGMGPGGRPRWQPATSGLPRSAAYGCTLAWHGSALA